jgi:hypothetical protein
MQSDLTFCRHTIRGILERGVTGLIISRSDLSERYSIFGAAELVKLTEHSTVPIRLVNPMSKAVKIYKGTRLASFSILDSDVETFELNGIVPDTEHTSEPEKMEQDYSALPDISNSVLNDPDKQKLRDLLYKYRDILASPQGVLGRSSLIKHTIDTGINSPIKQRPYRTSPKNRK